MRGDAGVLSKLVERWRVTRSGCDTPDRGMRGQGAKDEYRRRWCAAMDVAGTLSVW